MVIGIHVDDTQKGIDWEQVRISGIGFVILCCESGKVQQEMEIRTKAEACICRQIPLGISLYSRAMSKSDAEREAQYLLHMLQGYPLAYPVLFEMKDADTIQTLDRNDMGDVAEAFCNVIRQAGYATAICASKYWFTNLLTDARFGHWNRWIIQYYRECTYSGRYQAWQYTSAGRINGIPGPVPMSEYYENRSDKEMPDDLKGYVGDSLVGALNQYGYPSDFEHRRQLAVSTGFVGTASEYRGTANQNLELLRKLGGTVSNSKILKEGTYIKIKAGARNLNTGTGFADYIYQNTFQIIRISGISVVFGIRGAVVGKVNRDSVMIV